MKTDELIRRINSLNSKLSEKQKTFESIKSGNIYIRKIPDVVIIKRILEVVEDFKINVEIIEIEATSKPNSFQSIYDLKLDYFDNIIVDGYKLVKSEASIKKLNRLFNEVMDSTLSHNSLLCTAYNAVELEDDLINIENKNVK